MKKKHICLLLVCLYAGHRASSQVTTGDISGVIRSAGGEKLVGATVQLVHEPTGTAWYTRSNRAGFFAFANLQTGGTYTLQAFFAGHRPARQTALFVSLGETLQADLVLQPEHVLLQEVVVQAGLQRGISHSVTLDRDQLETRPAGQRGLQNYLYGMQAKAVGGNEGAVSFAGQNNRYNAFYIDGAAYNDLFGLAANGTSGGQAGISPLSVEAVEQLQASTSPYDASLGRFTGAAINAVTRSGSNKTQTSFYHFVRNSSNGDAALMQPAMLFSGKTYGFRKQGAIIRNRLFWFFNAEFERGYLQNDYSGMPYSGTTTDAKVIEALAVNIHSQYHYDPGSPYLGTDRLFADRLFLRLDWRASQAHHFSGGLRLTAGEKTFSGQSNAENLYFSKAGFGLVTHNTSLFMEWKTRLGPRCANFLALTYSAATDDRQPIGKPFPRVRIYDGDASIVFGTDISTGINLLRQRHTGILEKFSFTTGKQRWTIGLDAGYTRIYNAFIQYAWGSYSYSSIRDFVTNSSPAGYQLGFSTLDSFPSDQITSAASFRVLQAALFVNNEWRISERWHLTTGLRADAYRFPDKPQVNTLFNDSVLPQLEHYYVTGNAQTGGTITVPLRLSPRIALRYKPGAVTEWQLGLGVFSGRMPLAWPGGVYQLDGIRTAGWVAGKTELSRLRLRSDVTRQWRPWELQAQSNKDPVNLVSAQLSMPAVLRMSLSTVVKPGNDWRLSAELQYGHTVSAIAYRNINLLPPAEQTVGPGQRMMYTDSGMARVPLAQGLPNPYGYVILLGNETGPKGYSIELSVSAQRKWPDGWATDLHYRWGKATVVNEGTSSVNLSQWRLMESVNGRNQLSLSISDFSPGHRVLFFISRKFRWKGNAGTLVSLGYTGQSGWPFSYVYGEESIVRDDGRYGGYELIYIPTATELQQTRFLPVTAGAVVIRPEQQQQWLEEYISQNRYLRSRRGMFAERNGSRTPFMHTADLKIVQDLRFRCGRRRYQWQLSCEISNIGNLLNREWGKKYLLPSDQLVILDFMGYAGNRDPQYRLNPGFISTPSWPLSASWDPVHSAYWTCQFGLRLLW